jgi:hypothetical protein
MVKRTCLVLFVMILGWSSAFPAQPAKITSHIRRMPLASSALSAAGYSKRLHILEVEFRNGAVYRYLDVPPSIYREFQLADSKAQYYVWQIKGQYRSFRLRASGLQVAQK